MQTDAHSTPDRPLPSGYRFWLYPNYRLETPTVCLYLPDTIGTLLALMIANRGKRLWVGELFEALYGFDEDGGADTGFRIVQVHVWRLRRILREVGVEPVIESRIGSHGYVFRGFSVREPKDAEPPKDLSARYERARARISAGKSRDQSNVSASRKGVIRPVNSPPEPWRQRGDRRFSESTGCAWKRRASQDYGR